MNSGWAGHLGDTVVVGAHYEDGSATGVNGSPDEAASNSGAAFVYNKLGPAPDIEVECPTGVRLVDGRSSVSFASGLLGTSSERSFLVLNPGTADLTGLGLAIDGANAGEFTITHSPASSVPAGGVPRCDQVHPDGARRSHGDAAHCQQRRGRESFDVMLTSQSPPLGIAQQVCEAGRGRRHAGSDVFGSSVAVSGDVMVVGAPNEDSS
jgi:hypothetical protein